MKNWKMSCRGLRPAAELAADKPHGTRVKYQGGGMPVPGLSLGEFQI